MSQIVHSAAGQPEDANVFLWPNPELSVAGHTLPESQINELPFEKFL
jgi:hypothetical protein